MSPKSKTQKRNEQRRKNNKAVGDEKAKVSNNQQRAMHEMRNQNAEMQKQLRQLQPLLAMKEQFMKMNPSSPDYDPKWKPAAASDPPKIDEKYVSVPDPAEIALVKAKEMVDALESKSLNRINPANQLTGLDNAKLSIKEALVEAEKALEVRKKLAQADVKDVLVEHTDLKTLLRNDPVIMAQFKQLMSLPAHMLAAHRARHGVKLSPFRTKIAVNATLNGSSGTAISTVINIRPSAYTEWASFQALFDEFKVHGGCLHFNVWATGQTNLIVGNDLAVGYDPVDNAAYASVAGILVASQHFGPAQAMAVTDASLAGSTARTAAPQACSKHGFWQFPFKCPKGPQQVSNNSQQVMTGLWCDTNISSSLGDYGYLKPYVTSAGSTTATMSYYLVLDIEFRSRT